MEEKEMLFLAFDDTRLVKGYGRLDVLKLQVTLNIICLGKFREGV